MRNAKGQFVKGNTPWSKSQKGRQLNTGRTHFKKGFKHKEETKRKITLNHRRHQTEETRRKISKTHYERRELHPNWKGGITPERTKIWKSIEYKLWREAVFKRDKYTCVWCKQVGGRLNADHIKPFALFPELRFSIDNGRTLCVPCHRTTDTYGSRLSNKTRKWK